CSKFNSHACFSLVLRRIGLVFFTHRGLMVTIFLMFKAMHELVAYSTKFLFRRTILILLIAFIMGLVTYTVSKGLALFINYERRFQSLIALFIIAGVGVIVFGYLALKTRLAEKIIGSQAKSLRIKLHIK